ncbi:hypothetical protein [Pseudomonas trivialis]|uniref:Lipoprotein n=2 Tax=Pseudomonas trivialis TaxID=200450 RepID=A0ABY0UN63_9PSED|nr:hypothetical protein [Pseudomonas trivialis]SDS93833.1 hypothetical protein SAMN04490205_4156 [Pseudomonas trivialis]
MRMPLPLLITSFMLLSACTSYDRVWVKADATREQRKHQQTACEAEALQRLPPSNVRASISSTSESCAAGEHGCKKKTTQTDTHYKYTDENRANRETLVKDCMYRNGWSRTKVERPFIKW